MSKDPLFTVFDSTELERDLALIDRVKEKFNLPSDKDVADWLGVHKSVISEIRSYAKSLDNHRRSPGAAPFADGIATVASIRPPGLRLGPGCAHDGFPGRREGRSPQDRQRAGASQFPRIP